MSGCQRQGERGQRAVLSRWPSRHGLAYDGLGRLVSESESGVDPASVGTPDDPNSTPTVTGGIYADGYMLDLTGNRLEKDHVDGVNAGNDAVDTYVYNADDELTAEADAVVQNGSTTTAAAYLYDVNGNRISATVNGVTTVYAVDENNATGYSQVVEEMTAGVGREVVVRTALRSLAKAPADSKAARM